jgi:hypothetical protein
VGQKEEDLEFEAAYDAARAKLEYYRKQCGGSELKALKYLTSEERGIISNYHLIRTYPSLTEGAFALCWNRLSQGKRRSLLSEKMHRKLRECFSRLKRYVDRGKCTIKGAKELLVIAYRCAKDETLDNEENEFISSAEKAIDGFQMESKPPVNSEEATKGASPDRIGSKNVHTYDL